MTTGMTAIEVPAGSPFGADNLPYGVFSVGGEAPRIGVRVGDSVVDLAVALGDEVFAAPTLNPFMAQGYDRWVEVRARIAALVAGVVPDGAVNAVRDVTLHLPIDVADYVDFYASEHHASNVGRLFRPDAEPLLPNWKKLPVGYHGRAGTVIVSGTDVVRPSGQRKPAGADAPSFGPSVRLDIEAELGFVVGAGTPMNSPVAADDFVRHVFGAVLLNDWSARDIQAWEYVPLGPNRARASRRRSRRGSSRFSRWRPRGSRSRARRTRNRCPTCGRAARGGSTSSSSWSGTARRSADRRTGRCTGLPRRCWRT
jgi:fumarylacetoacetase